MCRRDTSLPATRWHLGGISPQFTLGVNRLQLSGTLETQPSSHQDSLTVGHESWEDRVRRRLRYVIRKASGGVGLLADRYLKIAC